MWQPAGPRAGPALLLAQHPCSPEADRLQRAELDRAARLLGQRILRSEGSAPPGETNATDPLLHIARLIYNRLPQAIMQALAELAPGSSLLIDAGDSELPWELAHDGEDFLALKVAVARRFLLPQSPRQNPLPPQRQVAGRQFTALIVGNPTGDLPHADREVEELVRLLQATPGTAPPRILMRRRATRAAVLGELASGAYDLVHYSGHAFFDPTAPESGGLILAAGEVLTGAEIEKNLGGRPFVFLNGCETAAAGDGLAYLGPTRASLAAAFIRGGAQGVAGSLWPVADPSAADFVLSFYRAALRGVPAGEALRQARRDQRAADPTDLLWASFALYGDPNAPLLAPPRAERRPATVLVARLPRIQALWGEPGRADEGGGGEGGAGPGARHFQSAGRLGPPPLAELAEQVEALAGLIVRYGGWPLALGGDLLTGVFGLSAARENDAERAVRAALEMVGAAKGVRGGAREGATARRRSGEGLGVAVGLSSGDVLAAEDRAGSQPGDAQSQPVTVLGEAVNQAVWLARQAGDGVVLAGEPVRRLAGALFELAPRADLRAQADPAFAAYQVMGPAADELSRWHAPPRRAPLIGRERELAVLREAWDVSRGGRGQIVSVVGEAGSGKSRLLYEFSQATGAGEARWLAAACPSSYRPGPYELVASLLRGLLGLAPSLGGPEAHSHLAAALGRALGEAGAWPARAEDVATLAEILAAPVPGEFPRSQVEPRARQRRIVELLGRLLAHAARQPLVVMLDDLHWADDASLEVLAQLAGGLERLPVLLVALFRSETSWQPPWWNRQNHRSLRLASLGEDESASLVAALFAPEAISPALARAILERAGGNPFFLRELALAVQESADAVEASRVAAPALLPGTVQRLILTRMEALPQAARRVLAMAAVAGDEVRAEVLAAAMAETGDRAVLDEGLIPLEAREFLYHRWGESSYRFTHALLREVAYDTIAADGQRRAHLCVGRALERIYAGREPEVLDLLAHHFDSSDDHLAALRYGLAVARRAAETWANSLALRWYGRVLDRLAVCASEPPAWVDDAESPRGARPDQLLLWKVEAIEGQAGVQAAVGLTDDAVRGYGEALQLVQASALFGASRQAGLHRKLAIALHDQGDLAVAEDALEKGLAVVEGRVCPEAGRLHVWNGLLRFRRGELAQALAACEEGIAILREVNSPQDLAQAHNLQGVIYRNMGESGLAIQAHERSMVLYEAAGDSAGLERATSNLGCVYQDLSRWSEALLHFDRSAGLADRTGEAWRQAAAAINLGEIYRRQGDLGRAIASYERAQQIGEAFSFPEVTGMALMDLGASYLKQGDFGPADECLAQSLAIFREIGTNVYLPEILRYQAELRVQVGPPEEALSLAQQAVDWATRLERRLELGQAYCVLGQAYGVLGQVGGMPEAAAQAEGAFRSSLSILDEQDNPYESALTQVALARFLGAQDGETSRAEARTACDRAVAVFDELGAVLDAARARELRAGL